MVDNEPQSSQGLLAMFDERPERVSHFIKRCKRCNTVLGQCRCPSLDKTIDWAMCSEYPHCSPNKPAPPTEPVEHGVSIANVDKAIHSLEARVRQLERKVFASHGGADQYARDVGHLVRAARAAREMLSPNMASDHEHRVRVHKNLGLALDLFEGDYP